MPVYLSFASFTIPKLPLPKYPPSVEGIISNSSGVRFIYLKVETLSLEIS